MIEREAVRTFKRICETQLNHPCTEAEAAKMAERVIRYLLATEHAGRPQLSSLEQSAFEFIKAQTDRHPPSVREIADALGLSSSRSGFRVVQALMRMRFVSRDENRKLVILS